MPQPRNLQNEIGNNVHETDGYDDNKFQPSQQKDSIENASSIYNNEFQPSQQKDNIENASIDNNNIRPSQQKYNIENASIGCSGKLFFLHLLSTILVLTYILFR